MYLLEFQVEYSSNCKNRLITFKFNNYYKCFIIINTLLLLKASYNLSNFILYNFTSSSNFNFIHLLTR